MGLCHSGREIGSKAQRSRIGTQLRSMAILAAALIAAFAQASHAGSDDLSAPDWGSGFISCPGAKSPVRLRAASPQSNIVANGVISCREDGETFIYAVEYMNFALVPSADWKSAHLEWFGSGAQRQGANGRSDWFYDEIRPIKVQIDASRRASVANLTFRVPKAVLAQARGFGFYVVGGGIFWTITLMSQDDTATEAAPAPLGAIALPSVPSDTGSKRGQAKKTSGDAAALVERAEWGAGFSTCNGARSPLPLKAASVENETVLANGIIACTDDGDAFLYTVDYLNFSLAPDSQWTSAHLEWFGCGAQRQGADGRNDWIFDQAKPIKLSIAAGAKRVAITDVSCRVPKTVLDQRFQDSNHIRRPFRAYRPNYEPRVRH
jgi:hypothetical protein